MQRSVLQVWLEYKSGRGAKQNDNTCFHRQCYMQKKNIYTHAEKCNASVTWIKKREGGIVGRAQRLPPKQNDNTCFHRQSCLIFFGTIFAIIFGIFSGNICALSVSFLPSFLPSFLAFIFLSSDFFLILSFFWSSVFFLIPIPACPEWLSGPAKVADFFAGCLSVFAWTSHDNVQTPFPVGRGTWHHLEPLYLNKDHYPHHCMGFAIFFALSLSSFSSFPCPPATKLTVSLSNLTSAFLSPSTYLYYISHYLYQTKSPHLYAWLLLRKVQTAWSSTTDCLRKATRLHYPARQEQALSSFWIPPASFRIQLWPEQGPSATEVGRFWFVGVSLTNGRCSKLCDVKRL